jgi:hypothetical protein
MVNAGLLNHPFHPHGNHLRMIAQDGRRFLTPGGNDASTEHFGETIASGATEDFLLTWKPNPTDPNSPDQPFPASVPIPSYRNLLFKDNNTWYSGSPYLGYKGTLPTGTTSQNVCGEFYYPWHSHALNEFTNFEAGFGGMATLMRVDPPDGCTSFPTSVKLQTGTLRAGGYSNLAKNDDSFYQVNSTAPTTATPPPRTDWYGAFSGLPAGASKLVVTYRGRNSTAGIRQTLALWNWATNTWTTLPVATLATDPSPPNPVVPQPAGTTTAAVGPAEVQTVTVPIANPATYIGKGSFNGQLQVQVVNERASGSGTFFTSGDLMKVTYEAP